MIDQQLVFWDRAGSCPDNSYSKTLFGRTPLDVLCDSRDSIAGPVTSCSDARYEAMFRTIVTHLDGPDLGLGPGHRVQRLPL